jgi:hypothetical protein
MSYDLYCYCPASELPNVDEARAVIESEEDATFRDDEEAREIKEKIAGALVRHNPRLERFKVDHNAVAEMLKVPAEEAKARWNHIELNPPKGDLAIQLEVYWDHVGLTIPYWYTGNRADAVFRQVMGYLRTIREAVGFFAYDPQADRAFDPGEEEFGEHGDYDRIAENLPEIVAQGVTKKPWWKLW